MKGKGALIPSVPYKTCTSTHWTQGCFSQLPTWQSHVQLLHQGNSDRDHAIS